MEESSAAEEEQYFANLKETRADRPFNYPDANPANVKLSKVPGKSEGLRITLKVMAGDTIEISAKAFYNMDNNTRAIRTDNLIRRVMGITTFRTEHGGAKIVNPYALP